MKQQQQIFLSIIIALALILGSSFALSYAKDLPEEALVQNIKIPGELDGSTLSTFDEAATALLIFEEDWLSKPRNWESENGKATRSLAQMGVSTNAFTQAQNIQALAKAKPLKKLQILLFEKSFRLELYMSDQDLIDAFADTGIEQGMQNAYYEYSTKLNIVPEQIGYGIDTMALSSQISTVDMPETLPLPLRKSEPSYTEEMLTQYLAEADAISERKIILKDHLGESVTLKMWEHMELILPSEDGFIIDELALDAFVKSELSVFENEAQNVLITESENGRYNFEGSARLGQSIDQMALKELLESSLMVEQSTEILVPTLDIEPEITVPDTLAEQGVTDLIGYGWSNFAGSPYNRVHNVNRGMEQFNGYLLQPGEEFSFTELMGDIDAENGWKPELVIKGDETIPEYGGGLCQVSSTMFRAALYTGLQITERRNHSYAVSYYAYPYGYGLDATIYDPWPNFKFANDTEGALLIQGYTEGSEAYFVFYGTNDKREVLMEGPYAYGYISPPEDVVIPTDELEPGEREKKDSAHTGFQVDWYRTVTYSDGSQGERENYHSNYEARPNQWYEGKTTEESE